MTIDQFNQVKVGDPVMIVGRAKECGFYGYITEKYITMATVKVNGSKRKFSYRNIKEVTEECLEIH